MKTITRPATIQLQYFEKTYHVFYEAYTSAERVVLQQLDNQLFFKGAAYQWDLCLIAFKRWLRHQACHHLTLLINRLSEQCQLPFAQVRFRDQVTRWGSCSSQKNISLNIKLLFLPRALVEYVVIHELCHTRVLDHSKKFWALVESFVPDYRYRRRELREAEVLIEDWYHE